MIAQAPKRRRRTPNNQPPPIDEIDVIEELVPVADLANDPAVIELTRIVDRAAAKLKKAAP